LLPRPATSEAQRQRERFVPQIIDPQQDLNLLVGHPRILMFADWATQPQVHLYLPDEDIARWDIISDTEIAIVGRRPGTTVLTIWFNDPTTPTGKRVMSFRLRVFEDPQFRETLADLEKQLAELFPASRVQLTIVHDRLIVRGQAKDAIEAGQILTVLAQTRGARRGLLGDSTAEETVTNLYIDQDRFEQEDLAATRRSVMDSTAIAQAGIINLLEIPGEQQVTLRVVVAEVDREAVRSIGADVEIGGSGDVSFVSLLLPNGFAATTGGNFSVESPDFRLALNALREQNFARVLAEPNVVALNGQTATFFAGNRVPIPQVTAGFGAVGQGVAFEQVGVQLSFTPFITDRASVNLAISLGMQDHRPEFYEAFARVVGSAAAYCNLGVQLQRQGQTDAARDHLEQALRLDHSLEPARQLLTSTERA
jgi:pilus assembly protein CpaC